MKGSGQLNETDQPKNQGVIAVDPFAVDFFGGIIQPMVETETFTGTDPENKKRKKTIKKSDWYKILPQVTNAEAELSFLLQNLPENFTGNAAKTIGESIARYTFREPENVKCSMVSVAEINLNQAIAENGELQSIFLKLGCQPDNVPAIIALNAEFAQSIIDFILGGQAAETGNWRGLSPIENTIIVFLAVKILGELNEFLGEPLLCLQNLNGEPHALFETFERGAEIVFKVEFDEFQGMLRLIAPQYFLNKLDKAQNPLLKKSTDRKKLSEVEKIINKLDLRLQIGTTFLNAESLLYLESDDIVLIEQPQINWKNGILSEKLQLNIGRGRNFRLRGNIENNEISGELSFRIEEILSEEARRKFTPAKFKMDEKENEMAEAENLENESPIDEESDESLDEQISSSLENIQVALRVEIAGNKLSLRELQNLRAGQIIGLGCRPTDPVRLVTDNNEEPVATGELIEIEGQLGVRLTKVFI
jgi:flagellar motor switch protein FliM